MKNNKLVCYLEEHVIAGIVSVGILIGSFILFSYIYNNDLASLKFQETTETASYPITSISSTHVLDGNVEYYVEFGDDSSSAYGFNLTVSSLGDFKEGDTWSVKEATYSCTEENDSSWDELLSLGIVHWSKPENLVRRDFKYLHQSLTFSETEKERYQQQFIDSYRDYLRDALILSMVWTVIIVLVINIVVKLFSIDD